MTWDTIVEASARASAVAGTSASAWATSPFVWLRTVPPIARGRAGQAFVSALLAANGYAVQPAALPQSLLMSDGRVVKVKMSMAWFPSKTYKFQQLENAALTHYALLGLEPHGAHLWVCPKDEALRHSKAQHQRDSRWIVFGTNRAPKWLESYGGDVMHAAETFARVLGSPEKARG